jgi:hypothetical protein
MNNLDDNIFRGMIYEIIYDDDNIEYKYPDKINKTKEEYDEWI